MMLSPCGPSAVPTGGAGVALPACNCSLMTVLIFFLLMLSLNSCLTQPLDLEQVELDGGLATEHVHEHLEFALLDVDLGHLAMEVRERPVDDAHVLADLVLDIDLGGRLGLDLLLDAPNLVLLQRNGLVARADEGGDARRVADHVPRLVGHDHVHEDVAREDPLADLATLPVLDLHDLLGRYQDVKDLVVHVHRLDALQEVRANLLFMAGVRVHHVPAGVLCGNGVHSDVHSPTTTTEPRLGRWLGPRSRPEALLTERRSPQVSAWPLRPVP